MYKIRTSECRVGIVGSYFSGKTVLLTSLLNHLQAHDPNRFRLGNGSVELRKFKELPTDMGWEQFNYRGHRDRLVHAMKWPEKTADRFQYVCQFERSDWHLHTVKLKIYDLPGERIADAIMAGKDYAEWSNHMVGVLENDKEYQDCCRDFLQTLDRLDASPGELLQAYRKGLAQLILNYKPYVSPSTFFLDTKGKMVEVQTQGAPLAPEEIASKRYAGLTDDSQFAPLPLCWRERHAELASVFAKNYEGYKGQVVFPWLLALKSCHSIVFLVDVLTILANGHPMYNDVHQIIADLLEVLDPGQSLLGKTVRAIAGLFLPHGWRPGRITRIAFVAPKLDLVYPSERHKMVDLVRQIARRLANNHDGLEPLYTNCSAVVSTEELADDGNGRWLKGRVKGKEQKFSTPELPFDWPNDWPAGKYVFSREISPHVPPLRACPPDQVNVDKLLDFAIGS